MRVAGRRYAAAAIVLLALPGCQGDDDGGSASPAAGRRQPAQHVLAFERPRRFREPAIWVANADGSDQRRLAVGSRPRVSPDGRAVVFARRVGDLDTELRVVAVTGGRSRRLLRHAEQAVWSPDSRSVATTTQSRLVIVDVASGAARTLAAGSIMLAPSFSPAGDRIVYERIPRGRNHRLRDLYVVDVRGGPPRRLTADRQSSRAVWGSRHIAYTRGINGPPRRRAGLWLIDPNGGGRRQLTHGGAPCRARGLIPVDWSTDGARLLAACVNETASGWPAVTIDARTGRQRAVRYGTKRESVAYRLSRDGSAILAIKGLGPAGGGTDVLAIPYDGGRARVLARRAQNPDWNR